MPQKLAFLHAVTPLHSGTGQGVGSIDLPIARERATNLPIVPGSSLKGCLRDSLGPPKLTEAQVQAIFGPARGNAGEHAGALRVSDARLLLLPVRCLSATFVWVTSPFLLRRLERDATATGWTGLPPIPEVGEEQALVSSSDSLITIEGKKRLVLEELDFEAKDPVAGDIASKWQSWIAERLFPEGDKSWRDEMKKRFAIVADNNLSFLANFSTEVNAHIAVDSEKGTVVGGALWYQEALPAESVLILLLQATKSRSSHAMSAEQVLASVPAASDVQFGGKATTGMGMARFVPTEASK